MCKKDYSRLSKDELNELAVKVNVKPLYLRNILRGAAKPSVGLAVALHKETNGGIDFMKLHPDLDWLYVSRFFNAFPLSSAPQR